MKILICGSLAYDSIMVFHDYFKNHILPNQIDKLSVAFYVPEMKKNYGGTAGNIAYNLKLINGSPIIMSTVGEDFLPYQKQLEKYKIDTKYIKTIEDYFTAQAFITTDLNDSQITSFHPGAMVESHLNKLSSLSEKISLAIIAPDGKDGMIQHANQCVDNKIPFLFDPGQGLPMFNKDELRQFINQATYIAVNQYESELLQEKSELVISDIVSQVEALIVTKGADGSEIYTKKDFIKIPAITAKNTIDPTGCGDAYRAGLTFGIVNNFDWEKSAKLASILGSIKIQSQGGQNHSPTKEDIETLFGHALN